ncbi:hypothetical protein BA896_015970 [Janthinobacterium lividum]|uniref:Uncharacterized protein n=1 Tax=Janthinobacterium lividum TaxID=29581 RepID=A0A1E8PMX8_9BURK|nr:hypothetical protein BA896_015970 [Janthinobacterium lividum]
MLVVRLRIHGLGRHFNARDAGIDGNRIAGRESHFDGVVEQLFLRTFFAAHALFIGQDDQRAGPFDDIEIGQFAHGAHAKRLLQDLGILRADAAQGADGRIDDVAEAFVGIFLVDDGIDIHGMSFRFYKRACAAPWAAERLCCMGRMHASTMAVQSAPVCAQPYATTGTAPWPSTNNHLMHRTRMMGGD